jgi:hypothetical protein
MANDLQLITDGHGLAVIGPAAEVDRFLAAEGLSSQAVELPRLQSVLSAGAAVAQAGSQIAADSGRWVKLTKKSADLVSKHGLRESAKSGLSTGVIKGSKGQVKGFVEFAKGPGASLSNPALVACAAGIMAQLAMQQTMNEITDYLARIDEKVDDVLRAQKDAVLAKMIGVGMVIDEAMAIREQEGRVSEVTWSKVQAAPATIAETQAYALAQIDALAEKLDRKKAIGDIADAAKDAESSVKEWLAVLARCFQLQDAIAVIELDRVLDAAPDDLNAHRRGLRAARRYRLEVIARTTERLLARLDAAAGTANAKVLLHPAKARAVVDSGNQVSLAVSELHQPLGIETGRVDLQARRWLEAATEAREKVLEVGAEGVGAVRRLGSETVDRAKSTTEQLSKHLPDLPLRRRDDG